MTTHTSTPRSTRPRRESPEVSTWRNLQTVLSVALLVATVFTFWNASNLFAAQRMSRINRLLEAARSVQQNLPTPPPSPRPPIGIVAGHWGHDPGAVCPDGLTEESINLKIATLVKQRLMQEGFQVDLFQEFDTRLNGYQGLVLLSIHNDSCEYINDQATGFKVAAAQANQQTEKTERLTACLIDRYQRVVNLPYHPGSVTEDMTEYHAFSEINGNTPAAIIETGFMNLDRDILVNQTDRVAEGVARGILCYLRNETIKPGGGEAP